jgi:hypothetical protein
MENYIVRIYQRRKDDPYAYVGVVEGAGIKGKKAFTNVEELYEILKPKKKQKKCRETRSLMGDGGKDR